MSKLGNETAKYVHVIGAAEMVLTETEQRWVELHGNYCKFGIMSRPRTRVLNATCRHTVTLRFPEVCPLLVQIIEAKG